MNHWYNNSFCRCPVLGGNGSDCPLATHCRHKGAGSVRRTRHDDDDDDQDSHVTVEPSHSTLYRRPSISSILMTLNRTL